VLGYWDQDHGIVISNNYTIKLQRLEPRQLTFSLKSRNSRRSVKTLGPRLRTSEKGIVEKNHIVVLKSRNTFP
jgi:hypothetical protein